MRQYVEWNKKKETKETVSIKEARLKYW